MLANKEIEKILILRPTVAVDEDLGYLKGDMKENVYPYIMSIVDPMMELLGKMVFDKLIEIGIIQIEAIGFMRGRSIKRSFIIVDELQNCSPKQLHLLLTRIEDSSKITLSGDSQQCDLKDGKRSATDDLNRFVNREGVGFHVFSKHDIVRGKFTQIVDSCYPEYNNDNEIDDYDKYAKKLKPKKVKSVKSEKEIETYDYGGHWQ
jgi:phosphate starvation-inducible PhoH-like protein